MKLRYKNINEDNVYKLIIFSFKYIYNQNKRGYD